MIMGGAADTLAGHLLPAVAPPTTLERAGNGSSRPTKPDRDDPQ